MVADLLRVWFAVLKHCAEYIIEDADNELIPTFIFEICYPINGIVYNASNPLLNATLLKSPNAITSLHSFTIGHDLDPTAKFYPASSTRFLMSEVSPIILKGH